METAMENLDWCVTRKVTDLKTLAANPDYQKEMLLHLDADDEQISEAVHRLIVERMHGNAVSVGSRIQELGRHGYAVHFHVDPITFGLIVRAERLGLCWQEYIPFEQCWQIDAAIRKALDKLVPMIGLYDNGGARYV